MNFLSGGSGPKEVEKRTQSVPKLLSAKKARQLALENKAAKNITKASVKLRDLTVFIQQLSSMIDAGLALATALEAIEEQQESPAFRVIIRNIRQDISGGSLFSEAIRKYPRAFPNLFISMVEAGEASGDLAKLMNQVAGYYEKSIKLSSTLKGALMYPIGVVLASTGIVIFLLKKVVPVFTKMFVDFGAKLPKPTQLLVDMSNLVQDYGLYLLVLVVGGVYVLRRYFKTPKGRVVKDTLILKVPVFGELIRKVTVSRFVRTYAILLQSGVPILRTVEICSKASGNTFIEQACVRITDKISQGGQFSEALEEDGYIPNIVRDMAKAGERTGDVERMFNNISDFYDDEVNAMSSGIAALIQPAVVIFLGVVIGGIVVALFLPIFSMADLVSGK